MIAMIISFFVVFLSFNFFMYSYQVNGINRLVYGMPISLYETAINMIDINEEEGPYFNASYLIENLTSYYSFHMSRYCDDYDIDIYFYNIADHSLDLSDYPRAVEVSLSANLVMYNEYHRTMFYEIRSN